jgi:hypothetical protein
MHWSASSAVMLWALLTLSCGGGPPRCGPGTCDSCCAPDGSCVAPSTSAQCGAGGGACRACAANERCEVGLCAFVGGDEGVGGGGGGGLGGSGGGGGAEPDGGCGCTLPNAEGSCSADGCEVGRCDPGYSDADGTPANGCEATCEGLEVSASGALDLSLATVNVSGRVLLEGKPAPASEPRGTLSFLRVGGVQPVMVELPSSGAATWQARLVQGSYEVRFSKSGDCRPGVLPCGTQVLSKRRTFTVSGAIDLDVRHTAAVSDTVRISGEVRVNGRTLPSGEGSRGRVLFRTAAGVTVAEDSLGSWGAATFEVTVPLGRYDVLVDGAPACSATSGPLPCAAAVLRHDFSVTATGALNLDARVVQVGGQVLLHGQPLPGGSSSRPRGVVVARSAELGTVRAPLEAEGPGLWQALLHAGSYQLGLEAISGCVEGPLPCQSRRSLRAVSVSADATIDLDAPVVALGGTVTVNGQRLADGSASRGTLSFVDDEGSAAVALSPTGPGTWKTLLYTGTYDVRISASDCDDGPLPCQAFVVRSGARLAASGALPLDLPVAEATVALTVNGTRVRDGRGNRGLLRFEPTGGARGVVQQRLGASGPATVAARLYPGRYQLSVLGGGDCEEGPLPCQTRTLEAGWNLTADGARAFDLPVLDVKGQVTANQATLPATTASARGELWFRREGGAEALHVPILSTGQATYRARVYPGTYAVGVDNPGHCESGALPCQSALLLPAKLLIASETLDLDVPLVRLSGIFTLDGQRVADSARERGELRFAMQDTPSRPVVARLSSRGAATYTVVLVKGRYDLGLVNPNDCTGPLPCQDAVVRGCRVP